MLNIVPFFKKEASRMKGDISELRSVNSAELHNIICCGGIQKEGKKSRTRDENQSHNKSPQMILKLVRKIHRWGRDYVRQRG